MVTKYAVTIDTEEQWDWEAGWPVPTHSLANIRVLPEFQSLCARNGARTTWFTNWSVMEDAPTRRIMLHLSEIPGVELAMHIHPWLTPPLDDRATSGPRFSYLANHSPDRIWDKLESVYATFSEAASPPVSFRGGRYSSGGRIHEFLMSKGFVADSSVVPFTAWKEDGAPDYRCRGMAPRRHSRPAGGTGFWELPLTLGFTRTGFEKWASVFNAIDHSPLRHLRLIGLLGKLRVVQRVWLNFEDTSASEMFALLNVVRKLSTPYVIFTVHSSSLLVGGNPYARTSEDVRRIWSTVETVLQAVRTWPDFAAATIAEIAECLEAEHLSKAIGLPTVEGAPGS